MPLAIAQLPVTADSNPMRLGAVICLKLQQKPGSLLEFPPFGEGMGAAVGDS